MYPIEKLQKIINEEIKFRSAELIRTKRLAGLYEPVAYSLCVGGKRLRPVLLLMGFNLFSEEIGNALPAAVAVEMFHNFTLLHDDIMDRARLRRNKPTVHVQFGENNAILSGDSMAFLSYHYLMECKAKRLYDVIRLFTETALKVCEGQQYDMDFEKRKDVTEAEYLEMIRLKTAILLGCSLKSGALLANSPNNIAGQLYDLGISLGLAFQLQDDLLDTYGDQVTFGKKIGGDILANKKTYLLIKAMEEASGTIKQTLDRWLAIDRLNIESKIFAVRDVYNQLGIKGITEEKIEYYYENVFKILKNLPLEDKQKDPLMKLVYDMKARIG